MKRISLLLIPILLCSLFVRADAPTIESKSAILINADSGQILYDHNAYEPLPPASTTKIMTALLLLERGDLESTITSSKTFVNPGGSHIAIDHEETLKIKDLLYALLVESANDAAVVLAEAVAGSEEDFVAMMNDKAKALNLTNSTFVNPHGLDAEGHLMSAIDLANVTAEALKKPAFREIIKTKRYTIAPTNKKSEARNYLRNGNLFLYDNGDTITLDGARVPIYDERVDGVKTGYTEKALNCLVSSFRQDASRYIIVVMGAKDKEMLYGDSKRLIDYASEGFSLLRVVTEGEVVTNIKVKNAESSGLNLIAAKSIDRAIDISSNEEPVIEKEIELLDKENDTILMGTKMGVVKYVIAGETIATVDLLAQRDIDERDLVGEITHALSTKPSLQSPLEVAVLIVKILLTLFIWRFLVNALRRRRSKQARDRELAKIRQDLPDDKVIDFKRGRKPRPKK